MTATQRACLAEAWRAAVHLLDDALFVGLMLAAFVVLVIGESWQALCSRLFTDGEDE